MSSMNIPLAVLGLMGSLLLMVRAGYLVASGRGWLGAVLAETGPDLMQLRIASWKQSDALGLRIGHAVVGTIGPESVGFSIHCFRRSPMFWRSTTRVRLDVQKPSQHVVGILHSNQLELVPEIVDATKIEVVARALKLLAGRPGAMVVVLPDRVHVDIPLKDDADIRAALRIALALPTELDFVCAVQRAGGFREAALPVSDEAITRALHAAGPLVTVPEMSRAVMSPPAVAPDLRPEAMLWPPPAPKDDD